MPQSPGSSRTGFTLIELLVQPVLDVVAEILETINIRSADQDHFDVAVDEDFVRVIGSW